jgi:hypothetical protein
MITVNTKTPILDLKGEPIMSPSGGEFTIGEVISNVMAGKVSNPHLGYVLAKKFATEDSVDLKIEEATFVKKELEDNAKSRESGYIALVIGQCIDIIDGTKN